jgi:nitrite reductase (cytochrome c-552)
MNASDKRRIGFIAGAFLLGIVLMAGVAALLANIQTRKNEQIQYPLKVVALNPGELDPVVWGRNFPREYDSFMQTSNDTLSTPHGGSVPFDKLARFPATLRIWAGYAFTAEYNKARGHYYALIDQKKTKRQEVVKQPGACANCHSADAPQLISTMGWETFSHTPYAELSDKLKIGPSCADCHDPDSMALRITRPAFKNAMAERGIDLSKASRQEMRTYVCAQCHVEYYFKGDDKLLTFPWKNGLNIDNISEYYNQAGFKDWVHKDTNAAMIKIQHPEFETWSSGIHARSGVACADCHMPYVREGAVKVSDHWLRSPLTDINRACQTCHKEDEQELKDRVVSIQNTTADLTRKSEAALTAAIDAIKAAQSAGTPDDALKEARQLQREASLRWDFVFSENSTGFHSPQEAARILANSIDMARQSQLSAEHAMQKK